MEDTKYKNYLSDLLKSIMDLSHEEFVDRVNNADEKEIDYWCRWLEEQNKMFCRSGPGSDFYYLWGSSVDEKRKLIIDYYGSEFYQRLIMRMKKRLIIGVGG